jgi:hypothetical protein
MERHMGSFQSPQSSPVGAAASEQRNPWIGVEKDNRQARIRRKRRPLRLSSVVTEEDDKRELICVFQSLLGPH